MTGFSLRRENDRTRYLHIPYSTPDVEHAAWMKMLTAALIFDATQAFHPDVDWVRAAAWSPFFFNERQPDQFTARRLGERIIENETPMRNLGARQWFAGWSASPVRYPEAIFRWHFTGMSESETFIFRHTFYDQYLWFVQVDLPAQVRNAIVFKASE